MDAEFEVEDKDVIVVGDDLENFVPEEEQLAAMIQGLEVNLQALEENLELLKKRAATPNGVFAPKKLAKQYLVISYQDPDYGDEDRSWGRYCRPTEYQTCEALAQKSINCPLVVNKEAEEEFKKMVRDQQK